MATGATEKEDQTETGRLEAFSDGVFAVAITLLALTITVPHKESGQPWFGLVDALLRQWPVYLAYLLSFVTILIMWVNHHGLFRMIKKTDHFFLILNGLLLMVITTIPFATAMLADYIQSPDKKAAVVVYSGISLVMALVFNRLWVYASRDGRLLGPHVKQSQVQNVNKQFAVGPASYGIAFVTAFVSAEISLLLCIALALFYALPSTVVRGAVSSIWGKGNPADDL